MPDALQPGSLKPRVTLVMTVRERHRLTLMAIESILGNTAVPLRLVFAHGGIPGWLGAALAALERAGRLAVRHFPGLHWPQQLRRAVAGEIDTEYVVFIDNDVLVSSEWLERLVECADQTGAGSVGPLYLWGDGMSPPRVHMAGGMLHEAPGEGGRHLEEEHRHINADPARLALRRGPCDYVEFHCMLVRTELARRDGVLDDAIACVHEHIHVALSLRALGHATWLEPAAQVNYLAYAPQVLEDLALLRQRWNAEATEASIAAFCRRWDVLPDDRSFGGVRGYVRELRAKNDPVRPDARVADHDAPLARGELPQGVAQLLELARARGYDAQSIAMLARGCEAASALTEGARRPDGRALLQHLVGTAGVLVRYDFCIDVLLAALLHAAYTHSGLPAEAVQAMIAAIHPDLDARVRDYTDRAGMRRAPVAAQCGMREAYLAAIEAANELDMRLSGEYQRSGRPAELAPQAAARHGEILRLLGVGGMAATLEAALQR